MFTMHRTAVTAVGVDLGIRRRLGGVGAVLAAAWSLLINSARLLQQRLVRDFIRKICQSIT